MVVVRLPVRHKVVSYRKKATLAQSPFFIPAVALTCYIAYSFLNESIDLTGKVLPRAAFEASCMFLTGCLATWPYYCETYRLQQFSPLHCFYRKL
jgi:hypothetical protein